MQRQRPGLFLVLILLSSFILGYALAYAVQTQNIWNGSRQPAINIAQIEPRISQNTPIIYEREYTRSGKVVISEFSYKEDLIGKTVEEIRAKYSSANGFKIVWQDNTLMIHQRVEDWSQEDKGKLRLKEYRDMVAVYQGPDIKNDKLLRVTAIRFSTLPTRIQAAIRAVQYEFKDEEALNDALENMDEYI